MAGAFGLAGILVAGGGGQAVDLPMTIHPNDSRLLPPEERVSRALFGALHERTVDSFSKSLGFGFSRIGHGSREHMGVEQLWTILPPESAGYEVALIGLENEPQGTVYSVKMIEPDSVNVASVAQIEMADSKPESVPDIAVVENGDLVVSGLTNPSRRVEKRVASDVDREMLGLLERDGEAPMMVDSGGERVMMYGGIRANQQRCVSCHKCEPGTLLGAFRYVFEVPAENGSEVASR